MAKLDKRTRDMFLHVTLNSKREYIFSRDTREIKDHFIVREVIHEDDKKRKKEFKEFCITHNYAIIYSIIKAKNYERNDNRKLPTGYIAYAGFRAFSAADRALQRAEKDQQDRLALEAAHEIVFENWRQLRAIIRETRKSIIRWKGKFEGDAVSWLDADEVSLDDNEHYYIYRIYVKEKDLCAMFNNWKKTCRYALEKTAIQNWLDERPNPLPVWELLKEVLRYYTHWDKVEYEGRRVRGRRESTIFFKFESLGDDTVEATLW